MSIIDQLLKGSIDMHVHAAPDPMGARRLDAMQLALQAKEAGMSAVVFKSHHYPTAPVAQIVNQVVQGVLLIGSLTLNRENGGLNPIAVEASAKLGAKVIWMPTINSTVDLRRRGKEEVVCILNEEGKLAPQMKPILEIIESNNLVLATGHISLAEILALADETQRMGIKLVVTHPLTHSFGNSLTIEQQQALVARGAYIEHCFNVCMPLFERLDPKIIAEAIKTVGSEHCILSTDLGQVGNPSPVEGVRMMIAAMLKCGLNRQEVELLVSTNPSHLLSLD